MKQSAARLGAPILELPRMAKRLVVLFLDFSLCILSVWLAYYLRLGEFVMLSGDELLPIVVSVSLALPIFMVFGLYRAIFRYSGWPALMTVARAISIYAVLYVGLFTAIGFSGVPRTVGIIQPILLLLLVGASRAFARMWVDTLYSSNEGAAEKSRVLVYGAGRTGRQLVDAMTNSHEMQVVGFLDDDSQLRGQVLNAQPVYDPEELASLITQLDVNDVLLAMPNLNRNRRNEILSKIRPVRVAVRTIPSVNDLVQGKVSISDVRELDIDDLLGRNPVLPNLDLLRSNVSNKVVMVTGAGGSIGSELCRQIIALGPKKLLLIDQNEFVLYKIHQELENLLSEYEVGLLPLLASVRDQGRMKKIMSTWMPDTVYHAAAYKHVPLVEHNVAEGIGNNVLGTLSVAKAASSIGVSDFVLISTDKAVRPTNIMGASKRLAEMVLQALATISQKTNFSMVRFGNVLGSSGSVVPKFRQQIREGGPLTLTHPKVNRYFMTIPEASQLVIQAGAMSEGNDVFVLDMGKPVKILDLARRMIDLSGLTIKDDKNPLGDIEIVVTGLRPGEKLYEELLIGNDPRPTIHPRIMKANEEYITWDELEPKLYELQAAVNSHEIEILKSIVEHLVPGYSRDTKVVDWISLEQ